MEHRKPGFYLVDDQGKYFGPIVNDNHKRDTYTDKRIIRKVEFWGQRLDQQFTIVLPVDKSGAIDASYPARSSAF